MTYKYTGYENLEKAKYTTEELSHRKIPVKLEDADFDVGYGHGFGDTFIPDEGIHEPSTILHGKKLKEFKDNQVLGRKMGRYIESDKYLQAKFERKNIIPDGSKIEMHPQKKLKDILNRPIDETTIKFGEHRPPVKEGNLPTPDGNSKKQHPDPYHWSNMVTNLTTIIEHYLGNERKTR